MMGTIPRLEPSNVVFVKNEDLIKTSATKILKYNSAIN